MIDHSDPLSPGGAAEKDMYPCGETMPQYAVLGIGAKAWVELTESERNLRAQSIRAREVSISTDTFLAVMNVLRAIRLKDFKGEAEKDTPMNYNGHIDPDCEVYRGVGAYCTCETPAQKAERARERAEVEAERDVLDKGAAEGRSRAVPSNVRPSIEQLRSIVSMLANFIWTKQLRPGEHLWSIPADESRDFDCLLMAAIDELERYRALGEAGASRPVLPEPLAQLRARIEELQRGTRADHPWEEHEVNTIQKTLNVVLAEIAALTPPTDTAPSSGD